MNKREIDTCQHEKEEVLESGEDLMTISERGVDTLVINVCKKCRLLYAEALDEKKK